MEFVFGALVVIVASVFAAVWWHRSRKGLRMVKDFERVAAATIPPIDPVERELLERGAAAAKIDLGVEPAVKTLVSSGREVRTPTEEEAAAWRGLYTRLSTLPDKYFEVDARHRANWRLRIGRVGAAYVVLQTRKMHGYAPRRVVCAGATQPVLAVRMPLGTVMTNELVRDASVDGLGGLPVKDCVELTSLLADLYKVGD